MTGEGTTRTVTGGPAGGEHTEPIPARFWWLRRLSLLGGVFFLGLLGLRIWWGWEAERRLQAAIDQYRAAGQPVLLEDFAVEPVPDDENAALLLKEAAALITQQGSTDADDYATRQQRALELVREARSKSKADWHNPLTSPLINVRLPQLSAQRELAKMTAATPISLHRTGDDAGAIETVRDLLGLGRQVEQIAPLPMPHLVRLAIEGLATEAIETLVPELRIGASTGPSIADGPPARHDQVQALIGDLLSEDDLRAGWARAVYGARLRVLDSVQSIVDTFIATGSVPERLFTFTVAPAWRLDAARMMVHATAWAEVGAAPHWPAAHKLAPPLPADEYSPTEQTAHLLSFMTLHLERASQLHFRNLAERRMAATALAIRLYELDHGIRPATLAELVPDYLLAVPRDPFARDDRPIGYRPSASPPVLYSVGLNGIDEGGAFELNRGGGVDKGARDIPFFLNGDRPRSTRGAAATPASAPATQTTSRQAVNDDQHVEDAERQQQDK